MTDSNYLSEIGLLLLGIILAITCIPIIIGVGIALLMNICGIGFYGVVIAIAVFIWLLLYLIWYY